MGGERTTVGRYRIRRVLGHGAMGIVYECHDPDLGRSVAVKTVDVSLAPSETDRLPFVERFLTEARAAAALSHPNIVIVYDIGRDESGMPFMALEHLTGETLEQRLKRGGALEWRTAVEIVQRLADALHHAHAAGIVHRDVKPANVMVLPSGDPKLMDFGIAKVASAQLTAAGQVFGSPSYMSPEQARGEILDARSDVFSLGAVLYEALTGARAFSGAAAPQILMQVLHEDPPPPSASNPSLPPSVDALVARALAKDLVARYPDAASLARDAARVLADPAAALGALPAAVERPSAQPADSAGFAATRRADQPGLALPAGRRVSLAVLDGPCQGQVLSVDKPRVSIGRTGPGATADLRLADPEVSRVHAVLSCDGRRFELQDLSSTNGTFVDGRRIEACTIEEQGEFSLGRTRVMLIVTGAE